MLWLALSIPDLPLAVFQRAQADLPFAVAEQQAVLIPNPAAQAAGVYPGMKLGAAQALCPQLQLRPRQPDAEGRALRQLAGWSLQFTPFASLQPPSGLLLEIGGSLRLFGGLSALLERVRAGITELGYQAVLAVAPTPGGAWLLNRGGDTQPVLETEALGARLEELPFTVLELDPKQILALTGLGITTLGDCLRLPRAGLARRLGPELPAQLDRALGTAPEPRRPYLPPPKFASTLQLPSEVEHCEQLLFALRRLLQELSGFLRGLDSGVQRLTLELEHAEPPFTTVTVGMVNPARDLDHLLALCRERLERTELRAPVRALHLQAGGIQLLAPVATELLGDPGRPRHLWTHLVERLYARLGNEAICGLKIRSEHRPEHAWAYAAPGEASSEENHGERPLWLLPTPQPLRLKGSQPCWHGPLVLQQGPERIETGWWDGQDVSRDYYIAENPKGARLWIFRERRRGQSWFLHGIFG